MSWSSSSVEVGFRVPFEEFKKVFLKVLPEKSHLEDRYSEKTGKKLKPVKIVDREEEEVYILDDKTYDNPWEFGDALGKKLGCKILAQSEEETFTVYSPSKVRTGKAVETFQGSFGDEKGLDIPISHLPTLIEEAQELKRKFCDLDIDLGEIQVLLDYEADN